MEIMITESDIEAYAIELLETQGYEYVYGPSTASSAAAFMFHSRRMGRPAATM